MNGGAGHWEVWVRKDEGLCMRERERDPGRAREKMCSHAREKVHVKSTILIPDQDFPQLPNLAHNLK